MKPLSLYLTEENCGLNTDFYQLTMIAGYHAHSLNPLATFEFFVRSLPEHRSYLIACGLEQVLHYLTSLHFTAEHIAVLQKHPSFVHVPQDFFDYLSNFRFHGTVWAVPEGTVVFPAEPILRITASLPEAQLVETYLLSAMNYQTTVATKASRICHVAPDKSIIDFGTRRAHGPQAALYAARASYIGGCTGTSNVLAAHLLGIPAIGTTAHSWVMAFPDEESSFQAYHRVFPESTVLLIDTYDTLQGAQKACQIGKALKGVRIDSGDLLDLSRRVRLILDQAGLQTARIVASGDLNEYKIADLLAQRAPIDIFGVGTEMVTSRDDPALAGVYKLVECQEQGRAVPKIKTSTGKQTYPGKKQIYRGRDTTGYFSEDRIGLADESCGEGEPLLVEVMRDGQLLIPLPSMAEMQQHTMHQLACLPEKYQALHQASSYPIKISQALQRLRQIAEESLTVR